MNAAVALFWLWGGAIGAAVIGLLYFNQSERASSTLLRVIASAYAPATAILFVSGAVAPSFWLNLGKTAFLWAQFMPLALLVFSLVAYPGPKRTHLWLLPLAVVCWLWQLGMGTMFIYGK